MTEGEDGQPTAIKGEAPATTEVAMLLGAERQAIVQASEKLKEATDTDQYDPDHDLATAHAKARILLEDNNLEAALAEARRTAWAQDTKVYAMIIEDLINKNKGSQALKIAEEADLPDSSKEQLLEEAAKVYAFKGDIEEAFNVADGYHLQEGVLADIAIAQAKMGDIKGAIETRETLHSTSKMSVDAQIAKAYVKTGNIEAAKELEHRYDYQDEEDSYSFYDEDAGAKDHIRDAMAYGFLEIGQRDKAAEMASTIVDNGFRAYTLAEIAKSEGPNSPIWEMAYDATKLHAHHQRNNNAFGDVERKRAESYAEQGDIEGAVQRALAIHEEFSRNYALSEIAKIQAGTGDAQALKTVGLMRYKSETYNLGFVAEAYADVAAGLHHYLHEHFGTIPKPSLHEISVPKAHHEHQKRIGAYALEQWRDFKNFDAPTFARLAHGAAEIAHRYMSEEERRAFIRDLAKEFQQFGDKGMFEDGQHQTVLKHMSEALVELEDPAATGRLLETLYKNMGDATGLRLIKTLVESGNAKAGAAGIAVLCDEQTPGHVYDYLLEKLAKEGYVDKMLPSALKLEDRIPHWASRKVIQKFYGELGIQMDSTLFNWVIEHTPEKGKSVFDEDYKAPSPDKWDDELNGVKEYVNQRIKEFESLDQDELLDRLAKDADARAVYFMLNTGRTKYTLIQHYNLDKFTQAAQKASEIQSRVRPEYINQKLWENAPPGWYEKMVNRRRPDDSLVWRTEVGGSSAELRKAARWETATVLGEQLGWLTQLGLDKHNFGSDFYTHLYDKRFRELQGSGLTTDQVNDMVQEQKLRFFFGDKTAKRLEAIFGENISYVLNLNIELTRNNRDVSVGDFEKAKNALLAQLRQVRNTAKQHKSPLTQQWKSVIERAEQEDPVIAMRHIVSLLGNNPELSLHPSGAVAEWVGHMNGLASRVREAQSKGSDRRQVTLRYLDGKEDFAELLRFADGAQCCFTSEQTIEDGEMDPVGEWRMRINRDPHWFVFSIEDTEPDAKQRISSGFVFGSLAYVEGQPALAINGVYMQRKTDEAANTILNQITERFAKPLGMKQVVIAAVHGGQFEPDKSVWRPAGGHQIHRPRAIAVGPNGEYGYDDYDYEEEDGSEPSYVNPAGAAEREIYDDLGQHVNIDQYLPGYCWIKTI